MKKLIKIADVLERIPVSRSQLFAMIAAGKFFKPVHLGGGGSFWPEHEVDAWIDAQVQTERAAQNPVLKSGIKTLKSLLLLALRVLP